MDARKSTPVLTLRRICRLGRLLGLALAGALLLDGCAPADKPPPETVPPSVPAPSALDGHGRMVVEAMEYPWSALGRLNTGGRGFCTGTLIGPRLVLVAARCLYNATEGRWWAPIELHFVAGYQRDAVLIHSRVAATEVAPGFDPRSGASLANVTGNWGLVTLETPIGRQAGRLALQPPDRETRRRIGRGEGFVIQAGYRRGWAHAITVKLGCVDRGPSGGPGGAAGACSGAPKTPELPFLLVLDGQVRALASPLLFAQAESGRIKSKEFRALRRNSAHWGGSRPPDGGPASRAPVDSVARLLGHLGYLRDLAEASDPRVLRAAIRRFETSIGAPQTGTPPTGTPTVALLGRLMDAVRKDFANAPPRVSMASGGGTSGGEFKSDGLMLYVRDSFE